MKEYKLFVVVRVENDCEYNEYDFSDGIVEDLHCLEGVKTGFALTMSEAVSMGFSKEVEEAA